MVSILFWTECKRKLYPGENHRQILVNRTMMEHIHQNICCKNDRLKFVFTPLHRIVVGISSIKSGQVPQYIIFFVMDEVTHLRGIDVLCEV